MEIKGLFFQDTCSACPEQYDVYKDGQLVGYVRLRWGGLSCEYPYILGERIYTHAFDDGYMGCFESDEQRQFYLSEIADSINKRLCCNKRSYYNPVDSGEMSYEDYENWKTDHGE